MSSWVMIWQTDTQTNRDYNFIYIEIVFLSWLFIWPVCSHTANFILCFIQVVNGICTVQFCGESTSTIGYGTVHGAMEVVFFCFRIWICINVLSKNLFFTTIHVNNSTKLIIAISRNLFLFHTYNSLKGCKRYIKWLSWLFIYIVLNARNAQIHF